MPVHAGSSGGSCGGPGSGVVMDKGRSRPRPHSGWAGITDHSGDSGSLRLGPAAAALPEPFVEAMRRFHDQLPRPAQAHEESGDDSDGDVWESAEVEGASWREGTP